MNDKIGSVRIVRADKYNIAVEVLSEVSKRDGSTAVEWKEAGYYGHRLKWAAESALYEAMPFGEPITPELIQNAVATIVDATKKHFEATT